MITVALITAAPTTLMVYFGWRNGRDINRGRGEVRYAATAVHEEVKAVHAEVKPNNGLTAGETVDAILTKQIQLEPKIDRSLADASHMASMAANDPAIASQEEGT